LLAIGQRLHQGLSAVAATEVAIMTGNTPCLKRWIAPSDGLLVSERVYLGLDDEAVAIFADVPDDLLLGFGC
jgi:hypothetical protein